MEKNTDMKIELDADHRYTVDGRPVPSVSKILDLYFPPTPFYTEAGRDMGTARHEWFHAIVQGIELENEPDERIAAEVLGFRRFVDEVKPLYLVGEVPFYDKSLDVCGKPDLYCEIQGRPSVIDFKPPSRQARWKVQTAAYAVMLASNGLPVLDRYALRILPGNYRMDAHTDAGDLARWRAMGCAYQARRFYGE